MVFCVLIPVLTGCLLSISRYTVNILLTFCLPSCSLVLWCVTWIMLPVQWVLVILCCLFLYYWRSVPKIGLLMIYFLPALLYRHHLKVTYTCCNFFQDTIKTAVLTGKTPIILVCVGALCHHCQQTCLTLRQDH